MRPWPAVQSRVRLFGHPLHPMVTDFAIVPFPLLVAFDILHALTGRGAFWEVSGWLGLAGVAGGILSILTGTIDLASIPGGHRVTRIAYVHLVLGIGLPSLYVLSVWERWPLGSPPEGRVLLAAVIDVVGLVGVIVQGYLGSEMRTRHHIGIPTVEEGAEPVALKR